MENLQASQMRMTNRAAIAMKVVEGGVDDDLQISSEGFHPAKSTIENRFCRDCRAARANTGDLDIRRAYSSRLGPPALARNVSWREGMHVLGARAE